MSAVELGAAPARRVRPPARSPPTLTPLPILSARPWSYAYDPALRRRRRAPRRSGGDDERPGPQALTSCGRRRESVGDQALGFPALQSLDRRDDGRAAAVRGLVLVQGLRPPASSEGSSAMISLGLEVVEGRGARRAPRRDVARLGRASRRDARPHARAVAQELLDLALVAVGLAAAPREDRREALVLAQALHRLARRVAVAVAGRLEPAVVEPRPKRSWRSTSAGMRSPSAAQRARGQAGRPTAAAPARTACRAGRRPRTARARRRPAQLKTPSQVVADRVLEAADDVVLVDELVARVEAEDRRHAGQREQRGCATSRRSGPRPLAKRSTRDRDVGVALGEVARRRDSASTMSRSIGVRGGWRRRIVLGEERRVVLLAAVVVRARLEDDLAHRRVRPVARGEDVHRADRRCSRGRARGGRDDRVDDQARVDDRVDLGRLDDPADQRVRVGDPDELGALELDLRRRAVDADDRLDGRVALERLGQAAAPVGRQAGDEDAARGHRSLGQNQTDVPLGRPCRARSSWIVARTSSATVCTSALSCHGSSPMSSVRDRRRGSGS